MAISPASVKGLYENVSGSCVVRRLRTVLADLRLLGSVEHDGPFGSLEHHGRWDKGPAFQTLVFFPLFSLFSLFSLISPRSFRIFRNEKNATFASCVFRAKLTPIFRLFRHNLSVLSGEGKKEGGKRNEGTKGVKKMVRTALINNDIKKNIGFFALRSVLMGMQKFTKLGGEKQIHLQNLWDIFDAIFLEKNPIEVKRTPAHMEVLKDFK